MYLGRITSAILPIATDVTARGLYVCVDVCLLSVTLVHPARTVGWNEMLFGSDTCVVARNILLDRGSCVPLGTGDVGVGTSSQNLLCKLWPDHYIVEWLPWTGYRNSGIPCPMVPSPTRYHFPFPKVTCSRRCCLVPMTLALVLLCDAVQRMVCAVAVVSIHIDEWTLDTYVCVIDVHPSVCHMHAYYIY